MNGFKGTQLSMLLISLVFMLSSCELIGGIFKAGLWVGIIIVVAIVALVIYFIGKARK